MTHAKSPIKKVELGQFVDRDTMRFVREYPHPIERVWSALTDPAQMKIWWMPCSLLETRAGGRYVLESPLGNARFEGRIKECDPPRLIGFSGVTRFELSPHEDGCRLVLMLKRWPNGWNPVSLAGFHAWLDHLRLHLDGFDYVQIMELARVWQPVYAGYEYLIQLNLADGAKVIHRVHFAESNSALRDSMRPVLDEVVGLLQKIPRSVCKSTASAMIRVPVKTASSSPKRERSRWRTICVPSASRGPDSSKAHPAIRTP